MSDDEIPPGSVYITPKQMWEAIQETRDIAKGTAKAVDELRLMVDPVLHDLRADLTALATRHDTDHAAHAVKIEALEKQAWSSKWVPTLVTAVLTAAATGLVLAFITHGLTAITIQ